MARKIRKKSHAKDDTKTQVDVAWAVGMRAGIDEGKRQMATHIRDMESIINALKREQEHYKAANEALRRYNDQHEKTIKELRKERGNAMDYIKRLESHLDPRVISTKLLVNSNGEPFNETSGSEKRLLLAGTETGRLSTGGIIDFKHVRPRGRPISREAYQRYAAAYGASQETIEAGLAERLVGYIDHATGPDQTVVAGVDGNGDIVRIDNPNQEESSFNRLQSAASRALAQEVDDAIMRHYGAEEDAEEEPDYSDAAESYR